MIKLYGPLANVMVVVAIFLATSCTKDKESVLLGKWDFNEVEVNSHSAIGDTLYTLTETPFFRNLEFYDDGTAEVEVMSVAGAGNVHYTLETFRWKLDRAETLLTMSAKGWNDMNWDVWILNSSKLKFRYIERYSNGTTETFDYSYYHSQRSNSRPR